jgi:hypothetical protein
MQKPIFLQFPLSGFASGTHPKKRHNSRSLYSNFDMRLFVQIRCLEADLPLSAGSNSLNGSMTFEYAGNVPIATPKFLHAMLPLQWKGGNLLWVSNVKESKEKKTAQVSDKHPIIRAQLSAKLGQ